LRYRITNINVEEFNKRIIFPFKIIAGILLLSEVIKQIANFGYNPLEDHYFTPAQLPFFFSDFQIFTLVAFVFSKPNTTFNKLGYVLFMMEGMAGSFFLLVAPNSVISFTTLSTDNFQYSTAHSFICHYAILYSFV
jgi:hypothetical protein